MELPLFPLSTVLFPGAPLPLHIFEERYRRMFARILAGDRQFGVVAIVDGREVGDAATYQPVGCMAMVEEVRHYPDGRLDVLARGGPRFRIDGVVQESPFVVALVSLLDDLAGRVAGTLPQRTAMLFARYVAALLRLAGEEPAYVELPEEPIAASWTVAAELQVDVAERQRLLTMPTAAERLGAEGDLLRRELALLERLQTAGPSPMAGPFSLN